LITNATLSGWQRVSGYDAHGAPTRESRAGLWRVAASPSRKTLNRGGRETVARASVVVAGWQGFTAGDLVTLLWSPGVSDQLEVLQVDRGGHGATAYVTLLLG